MSLFPLGILSAAGAGGELATYELIESTILTGTVADVTFTGLGSYSSTYKHFQLRWACRTNQATEESYVFIQINGDGLPANNYFWHQNEASSNAIDSSANAPTSTLKIGLTAGNSATASVFGVGVSDLLDVYSTTKNKTVRSFSGSYNSADSRKVGLYSGARNSTESTTSIKIVSTGSFVSGSRFSIYGIRG
jgi:hypothetical protein